LVALYPSRQAVFDAALAVVVRLTLDSNGVGLMRVLARVAIFGAVLGVLIQSMPLRVCALEQQIAGTNCHAYEA